jgi:hypothetical protein
MKPMNLRSYRKLEKSIHEKIAANKIHGSCLISIYDEHPMETVENQRIAFSEMFCENELLMEYRNKIRKQIQTANELSGINTLISERTLVMNKIQMHNSLLNGIKNNIVCKYSDIKSLIESKIERYRKSEVSTYGTESFEVCLLNEEILETLQVNLNSHQKRLRQIDDAILEKNMESRYTFLTENDWIELEKMNLV